MALSCGRQTSLNFWLGESCVTLARSEWWRGQKHRDARTCRQTGSQKSAERMDADTLSLATRRARANKDAARARTHTCASVRARRRNHLLALSLPALCACVAARCVAHPVFPRVSRVHVREMEDSTNDMSATSIFCSQQSSRGAPSHRKTLVWRGAFCARQAAVLKQPCFLAPNRSMLMVALCCRFWCQPQPCKFRVYNLAFAVGLPARRGRLYAWMMHGRCNSLLTLVDRPWGQAFQTFKKLLNARSPASESWTQDGRVGGASHEGEGFSRER